MTDELDDTQSNEIVTPEEVSAPSPEETAPVQEPVTPEPEIEPSIPLSRHKAILENARRGATEAVQTPSQPASEAPEGVDPKAIEIIKGIARQEQQAMIEATRDEIKNEVTSSFKFEKEVEGLQAKYDGKDGLPKFNLDEVMKYGTRPDVGIYNLELAYRAMNSEKIVEKQVKDAINKISKNPPVASERPGTSGAASSAPEERPRADLSNRRSITDIFRRAHSEVKREQG
jgi:hypothetical protein